MKKQKPIYVQIDMNTSMEQLWEHTQNPSLHKEWDLRFSDIKYLDKEENEPQRFLYQTNIGFGFRIEGEGESVGQIEKESGQRVSSLKFGTDQKVSLIKEGRGYWKYEQRGKTISFETLYDYETRFGRMGLLIDRYCFRPLLGWATAWSFDSLRLWLEQGFHPKLLFQKTITFYLVCCAIAFIWLYQGLVPKLIMAHPEEINMLTAIVSLSFPGDIMIRFIGLLEILFGLLFLLPFQKKKLFVTHIVLLILLTIAALISEASYFVAPFNPVTLNSSLLLLSLIGFWNCEQIPLARRCRRHRKV